MYSKGYSYRIFLLRILFVLLFSVTKRWANFLLRSQNSPDLDIRHHHPSPHPSHHIAKPAFLPAVSSFRGRCVVRSRASRDPPIPRPRDPRARPSSLRPAPRATPPRPCRAPPSSSPARATGAAGAASAAPAASSSSPPPSSPTRGCGGGAGTLALPEIKSQKCGPQAHFCDLIS